MRPDIKDRVDREAKLYDNRQLQRDGFETALTYLNDGIGRLRRNEAIRAAMQDATGLRVLEIGSQSWEWCLFRYGYRPEQLTCINISEAELEIGRSQAARLGVPSDFRKMDAHHLVFPCAMREIHRVLRDGGKIEFVEPLRHNPVGRLVRWLTPHARTPDELPLGRSELRLIERNFRADNYYSELFTVIGTMITQLFFKSPINPITRFCDVTDDLVLRLVPSAALYYRSVVIRASKRSTVWQE